MRLDLDLAVPEQGLLPAAVTIGNFDGVHLGHQRLVGETVARAASDGLRPVALTFDPHPARVTHPASAPGCLMSLEQRVHALEALGIDAVAVLRFSPVVARLQPQEFCERILRRALSARLVVVGDGFRFGRNREGDLGLLRECGVDSGFRVMAVDPVVVSGEPVSSSRIRGVIARGLMDEAARLLGRPFGIEGMVVRGAAVGRTLGFATANLETAAEIIPADGVYAGWCRSAAVGPVPWPAVVNVGLRPTFSGTHRTIEAHLLAWEGALYGEQVALDFVARLRGEQRFASGEELAAQIHADVQHARRVLEVPEGSRYSRESTARDVRRGTGDR
jgi:riboflavin kinase/FMN adenylyltransferase